jgi:hypothetical protein
VLALEQLPDVFISEEPDRRVQGRASGGARSLLRDRPRRPRLAGGA